MPAGGTKPVLPAGVVHNWWNAGDDLLELSGRAIPAGDLDRYLQAIFAVLNASPSPRPSVFYLGARGVAAPAHTGACDTSAELFSGSFSLSLFFVGRILGKYRDEIIGPARLHPCPGAPEA